MVMKQDLLNDPTWFFGPTKVGSDITDTVDGGEGPYTIVSISIEGADSSSESVSKVGQDAVINEVPFGKLVIYEDGDYFFQIDFQSDFVRAIPSMGVQTISIPYMARDEDGQIATGNTVQTISIPGFNDAPLAVDDRNTTDEDVALDVDVTSNDKDFDTGDTIMLVDNSAGAFINGNFVAGQTANGGTVVIKSNGIITYTPTKDFVGTDTFEYMIQDSLGETDSATVTIDVNPINDAPVAIDDEYEFTEDEGQAVGNQADGNILDNDVDVDGDTLTVTSVGGEEANVGKFFNIPGGGRIKVNADGTFDFQASNDFQGLKEGETKDVNFSYNIADPEGETDTAFVTIKVVGKNDDPDAEDDSAGTNEDTSVTIDVLDNDTDVDGDTLTITDVTDGANGTAKIVNGKVVYTPNANFNGTDTVTYTISDGNGGTDTAKVTIVIEGKNDGPNAEDDSAGTLEDTSVTIDVLDNDTDVDGDTLTITDVTDGSNGTAKIVNGKVVYTPNANFNGTDTVTYTISDGNGGTDTAKVTIVIEGKNDGPDARNDRATTHEDKPVTVNVLRNDRDADGDTLTITDVTDGSNGIAKIVNGKVVYTPNANFNGTDTVTYTISDGNGGTDTATLKILVKPVNDGPNAKNDSAATEEDTSVTIDVLDNDTDVDGDTLTITDVTDGSNGTAKIVNGKVVYTPNANFNGTDTITYTISDGNGGTDTATVAIVIEGKNDGPNAEDDNASTDEDTSVTIDVLANDTDLDGDTLTITDVTDGANGTSKIVNGKVVYTPNANFNGTDTVTYTISDGNGGSDTAKVTIVVEDKNDGPNAEDDNTATQENTSVTVDVLANDTDLDGDTLSITDVTDGANGTAKIVNNKVVYTPNANFNGTDTVTYTITDGNGGTDTATVVILVKSVNDDPHACNDIARTKEDTSVTVNVLRNDTDADGDALTIIDVTDGANGAAKIVDNKIVYTPNENFNGRDKVVYTISDGNGGTDTATLRIRIKPVNDDPNAKNDSAATEEDTSVTIDVLDNDTDVDGDTLTITDVTNGSNGTAKIVNGKVVYTPNANFNGTDTITYTISDGNGGTDTATVAIVIEGKNDGPNAEDDSASTDEDTSVTIDVLANDTDLDGDTLTITDVTDGANGTSKIVNGKVVYTPNANFNGTDTVTYTISDGNGGTDTATVTIAIQSKNDDPNAEDDSAATDENISVTVDVLANDTDLDGDTLTITDVTDGSNGTTKIVNGKLVYTPNANFNGTDTVTYTISDGNGGTDTATVAILVESVNNDPHACNNRARTQEDTPVTVNVLRNDTDADGDTLTIIDVTDGANGTAKIVDNKIVYTPNENFNGRDKVVYTISDGNGGTDTATLKILVKPVNDGPNAEDDSVSTLEDTSITVDVLTNDTDLDGDILTVIDVTDGSNGTTKIVNGKVVYTPNTNFNGTDIVSYTISDGHGGTDTATVAIHVKPVNDNPDALTDRVGTNEDVKEWSIIRNALGNDSDIDGDALKVVAVNGSEDNVDKSHGRSPVKLDGGGEVNVYPNGRVEFRANNDFDYLEEGERTTVSFDYTISDGNGGTDTATYYINVHGRSEAVANRPPVAVGDTFFHNGQNGTYSKIYNKNILENDSDPDGDDLTIISAHLTNESGKANGSSLELGAEENIEGVGDITIRSNGDVTFNPFVEDDTIDRAYVKYTVSDGNGGTDTAIVKFTRVSPIAFDMDGSGAIETTGLSTSYAYEGAMIKEASVMFDIDNDGVQEQIEWLKGNGDALLVDDRDGLAAEDMNGGRLFGNEGGEYDHGYEKLRELDVNEDGMLIGQELKGLKLWFDDGDAAVEEGELLTLEELGITEISTDMELVYDENGDPLMRSSATTEDGETIITEDVWFGGNEAPVEKAVLPENDLDFIKPEDIHDWS